MDAVASPRVVQVQPGPTPTQRATLVSSGPEHAPGARGLLPALEHLQRISHQRSPSSGSGSALPPLSSRGAFPSDDGGVTPGPSAPPHHHLYERHTGLPGAVPPLSARPPLPPTSSSSQTQTPALPAYRQASTTPGDGGDGRSSGVLPGSPGLMDPSLPDLLHSHMVPPQVPPARPNQHRHQRRGERRGGSGDNGRRHHRRPQGGSRQRRRSRTTSGGSATATGDGGGMCKEPCVRCVVTVTSFRWVLIVLSVLGVCCVATGVVLAALRAAGNSFLFLAIMFMGLGILLVVVVAVGWKCTPRGHEPLHALFGIGNFRHGRGGQTRERRRRRHRNRDGNWHGGVLYPEFQYRRPPPSYAASMQDYQNQQQREGEGVRRSGQPGSALPPGVVEDRSLPNSPPPSYRSRASTAHSGIHIAFPSASTGSNTVGAGQDGELPRSRPPTYRSRAPSRRPSLPRDEDTGDYGLPVGGGDADVAFTGESPFDGAIVGLGHPDQTGSTGRTDSHSRSSADAVTTVSASVVSSVTSAADNSPSLTASVSGTTSSSPSQASPGTSGVSPSAAHHSPSSVTLQVYTMPTVRAANQNSSSPPQSSSTPSSSQPQTFSSPATATPGASIPAAASTHQHYATTMAPSLTSTSAAAVPSRSPPPARLPSLHQRMESCDQRMLEDALQSLDEHISEGGIDNPAASFDPEVPSEDLNTHL